MGKVFKIFYILLAIIFLIAWVKVKDLPDVKEIDSNLLQEPIQADSANRDNFEFVYRKKAYDVEPLADYEIWGLVVSKNNIGAWYNIYHDENSVNLKDVCVVWGDNIKNASYNQKNIKFSSGEWTCYYEWTGRLVNQFFPNKLSNNHLLADNKAVLDSIRAINVGDQIHLKGALIDYAEKGSRWYRKTSLSREDENSNARGGGACEIMFVDKIDLIKQNNLYWNYIFNWKWRILFAVMIINLIWFFCSVRRNAYRK